MNIATCISLVLGLAAHAALPVRVVPSDSSQWDKDFLRMVEPAPTCPGGSVDSLRKRMAVSGPYISRAAFEAANRRALPPLGGVAPGDRYYSFSFRSELASGGFWGFGGYLVTRGTCIVHAEVTSRDN